MKVSLTKQIPQPWKEMVFSWNALVQTLPPFQHDYTLALYTGCICAVVHLLAAGLFAYVLPEGPWRKQPGFLAHRVVAIPLMLVLSWIGTPAFLSNLMHYDESTRFDRVHGTEEAGSMCVQIVLGSQIFWDIPATLFVPSLYSRLMLVHHVLLAALCPIVLGPYVQWYAPYCART